MGFHVCPIGQMQWDKSTFIVSLQNYLKIVSEFSWSSAEVWILGSCYSLWLCILCSCKLSFFECSIYTRISLKSKFLVLFTQYTVYYQYHDVLFVLIIHPLLSCYCVRAWSLVLFTNVSLLQVDCWLWRNFSVMVPQWERAVHRQCCLVHSESLTVPWDRLHAAQGSK